jgi:hypothetical protein
VSLIAEVTAARYAEAVGAYLFIRKKSEWFSDFRVVA